MSTLKWISDKDLEEAVTNLLEKAKEATIKANVKFVNNVIDPFSAIFEMAGFGINHRTWVESEKMRQAQKTLQNHIGEFHQNIHSNLPNIISRTTYIQYFTHTLTGNSVLFSEMN